MKMGKTKKINKLSLFKKEYNDFKTLEYILFLKEILQLHQLEKLYYGRFSKKYLLKKVLPISAGIYIGLMFLAGLLFPTTYSPVYNTISDLGNPYLNPSGWWLFSISFIFLAAVLILFCNYVYRRLSILDKIMPKIGIISNIASSIGLVILAIFPNDEAIILVHGLGMILAFGGLIVGGVFYWAIIVKGALVKKTFKNSAASNLSLVGIGSMGFIVFIVISIFFLARIDLIVNFQAIIDACFSSWLVSNPYYFS
jgi:hypothetical protein